MTTDTAVIREIAPELLQFVPAEKMGDFERFLLATDTRVGQESLGVSFSNGTAAAGRLVAAPEHPVPVRVDGLEREVMVKIASTREEWETAFALVASNYLAKGYEGNMSCKVRFTPYHALPDTVTFVAKLDQAVLMTLTLVPDNTLLGLPLECIFSDEVKELRGQRRRLGEVISLAADRQLEMREFRQVFIALIRLMEQFHVTRGGDTWVVTVNPRHSAYYSKALGCVQLGPRRHHPEVEGHPAEAFMLDVELLKANAPQKYAEIFGDWLPGESLRTLQMPTHMVRYLSQTTSPANLAGLRELLDVDGFFSSPRRW